MLDANSEERYTVREHLSGPVNHPHKKIYAQIKSNIRRQLPQVSWHGANDYKAMLLCGGPTLNDHLRTIKRKRKAGWKIITVNNTHNWALGHGLQPSAFAMMDAREHNVRFVETPIDSCRYLLCSQVHGGVFDALKDNDVHIWHGGAPSNIEQRILDRYYNGRWLKVPGGTSIGPRAMFLAYMLGMRELEVYGLDGCLMGGEHHAYEQPENDYKEVYKVRIGRKRFDMHGWMLKQFDEWLQAAAMLPDDYRVTVHGDGAISYVTTISAKQQHPPKMTVLEIERI